VLPGRAALILTCLSQSQHLPPDVSRLPALLLTPREGHYAVCALLVATIDDIDPGRQAAVPAGDGDIFIDLPVYYTQNRFNRVDQ